MDPYNYPIGAEGSCVGAYEQLAAASCEVGK